MGLTETNKIDFISKIWHLAWCCYQLGANQDYNLKMNNDQWLSYSQGVKHFLQNPNLTAEDNHINWMNMKESQGWVLGKEKDFDKKTHPDLIPYDELPLIEKNKDEMDIFIRKESKRLYELYIALKKLKN